MKRELNAQVAQRVMGFVWVENYYGTCKWLAPVFDADGMVLADGTTGPCIDADRQVPDYSTDLNACAQAEARVVEMGLGARYAEILVEWMDTKLIEAYPNHEGEMLSEIDYGALRVVLTASAEARCRAMLRVIAVD